MAFTKINAAGIGTTETVTVDGLTVINDGSFGGNLSVGGTITYEDVTNVDSVGLITARTGIEIGARPGVGASISVDGNAIFSGITTATTLRSTTGIVTTLTATGLTVDSGTTNTCATFQSSDAGAVINLTDNSARSSISQNGTDLLIISDTDAGDADSKIKFQVDSSTKAIIDSSGRLLVSGQAALTSTSLNHPIQVAAASDATAIAIIGRAADDIAELNFYEADKSTNLGELQYRQDHLNLRHRVGYISFATGGVTERLRINSVGQVSIRGTTTAFDTTGDLDSLQLYYETDSGQASIGPYSSGGSTHLSFYTNSGGGAASEKVRIDSDGRVLIGDTSTGNAFSGGDSVVIGNTSSGTRTGVTLVSANDQDSGIYFSDGTSTGSANVQGQIVYDHSSSIMRFYTTASERVRIDSNGVVNIGNASYGSSLGQLRIINDASSSPASLALFGYGNTTDNDPFGQIQFAEQEAGTGGQVKAKIEAQAVSTNERGSNLVFFTSANTSSSTPQERLRITEDGYVLKNNHPAFGARNISNANTNGAIDSAGTAIFSTVFLNSGGHYSNSTGKFTCPVDGIYHFSCTMLVDDNASSNATYYVDIRKNNSQVTRLGYDYRPNTYGSYHPYMAGSITLSAAASDEITIYMNAGGFHVGGEANFSGHLIG